MNSEYSNSEPIKLSKSLYTILCHKIIINILQGARNTDGMYPMRETALQVYVMACGYVLWTVTRSSVPWHSQTVETGNDDLHSCFHAVHGLKLFTTLRCKN